MDSELRKLLNKFNKKLYAAQDARYEIECYLEDKYGIDPHEHCEYLENEYEWCYGFDESHIENLIEEIGEEE